MIFRISALAVLAMGLAATPAWAQPGVGLDPATRSERAEPYLDARTALEINYLCNAYKSVEHWAVGRIAQTALGETGWYEAAADMAEYEAVIDEHNALAAGEAARLGCTPAAEPLAFSHLEQAMGLIYGDLLLAFHFASLHEDDLDHLALSQDQIAAAQQYDMYLQQRFGPNFEGFAQHHRDRVSGELQRAMAVESEPYGDGFLFWFDDPFAYPEWDFNWELAGLRADGRLAIDRVLLEVLVETGGMRMFDRQHEGQPYADILDPRDGTVRMKVWTGPASSYFYDAFDASYLLALTETGAIRFIVWSREAADQLGGNPTIAIHANPNPVPKGMESERQFYQTPEWMADAEAFRAAPTEDCFGTLCLEFSPEDVARMIEGSGTDLVELVISPRPDAGPAQPSETGYRAGGHDISLLRALHARWIQGS